MPKIRSVVVWTVAALVTAGMEVVGLHRAIELRNELDTAPRRPAPVVVPEASPAPETRELPKPAVQIGLLSVTDDAVEIEVDGRHHELPGYPQMSWKSPWQSRLTSAVIAPDGEQVAIAGLCHSRGSSDNDDDPPPACSRVFVRVYRTADGAHLRDLESPWGPADIEQRPLAIAFDAQGERLAVLVRAVWADCSWDGVTVALAVYRLTDGARIAHRALARTDKGGTRSLSFHENEVHVVTTHAHGRAKLRVVRLRTPGAA